MSKRYKQAIGADAWRWSFQFSRKPCFRQQIRKIQFFVPLRRGEEGRSGKVFNLALCQRVLQKRGSLARLLLLRTSHEGPPSPFSSNEICNFSFSLTWIMSRFLKIEP
jgi:hypothetical protein